MRATINAAIIALPRHRILILIVGRLSSSLSRYTYMKKDLREVYWAPNRAAAEAAIDVFAEKYRAKYGRAVECLAKHPDVLLAFYDFPAEHWDHLRTTNPIESVFATVRHRTVRTKGSLSSTTARLMVFELLSPHQKPGGGSRHKSVAEGDRRCQIQRRHRGPPNGRQTTPPDRLVTQNPA